MHKKKMFIKLVTHSPKTKSLIRLITVRKKCNKNFQGLLNTNFYVGLHSYVWYFFEMIDVFFF